MHASVCIAADGSAPITTFIGDAGTPCKYVKECPIGQGTSGTIFLVTRTADNLKFAAKLLHLDNERRRKYTRNEARSLYICRGHPFIVGYEDFYSTPSEACLVMEYANAKDLAHHMRAIPQGCFGERDAGILFAQMMIALFHIHRNHIVHRDIKSSNILLCANGLLKIGDFGFSKDFENTGPGTFLGTPFYLAPEMWLSHCNGRKADVWAAGVVLFEMVNGTRPFIGDDPASLRENVVRNLRQPMNPTITRDMYELLNKLLHPDPAARPTAAEVLDSRLMRHYVELLLAVLVRDQSLAPAFREFVTRTIEDARAKVDQIRQSAPSDSPLPYEAEVKKDSHGQWKDRVLTISETDLTLSLPANRVSAVGVDRSHTMPIASVEAVFPRDDLNDEGRFVFEVQLSEGRPPLLFATLSADARDVWLEKFTIVAERTAPQTTRPSP